MACITIESLSYAYPDGTRALTDLNMTIDEGDSVGIVGANGAGKSTLVNHLNGYYLPQHGEMKVHGVPVTKKNRESIRRDVGIVFQNPDDQLFTARVWDDVIFGPANTGLTDSEAAAAAEAALAQFGISELRDRPPSHCSNGQKRFVACAAVLAMKPSILVMDEPTSDLDPRNRRMLIKMVNALPVTRIIVSHDLDFIWETCTKVFVMARGTIVAQGTYTEILRNKELLETHGLELPLRFQ